MVAGSQDSIVVYISPLISIKGDQQQKFADKGIRAEFKAAGCHKTNGIIKLHALATATIEYYVFAYQCMLISVCLLTMCAWELETFLLT